MSTSRRRTGLITLTLVAALAVLVLGGCGGAAKSGGSAPSNASAAGSPSSGGADLGYAQSQISKYTQLPKFVAAGPPFDTTKAKGKTIFSISVSNAIPFDNQLQGAMKQAGGLLGITVNPLVNQGQPSQWVQGVQQAVSQHASLIDLSGLDPSTILPQIKAAQSAGSQVAVSDSYDTSQKPVGVHTSIPVPYEQAARLDADWVIQDTKGKADVLVVTSVEVPSASAMVAGIKDELSTHCGSGCQTTVINVPIAQWGTKMQSAVQSALIKDPNINYVIPIFDSMSEYVVPAIQASGRAGKVFIATFDGTPFVLKMIQEGNVVRMDVGEDPVWLGWAVIDGEARILAGQSLPPIFDEHTALRIFSKQNVNEAGTPPKPSTGYGNAYVAGYKQLWGVK